MIIISNMGNEDNSSSKNEAVAPLCIEKNPIDEKAKSDGGKANGLTRNKFEVNQFATSILAKTKSIADVFPTGLDKYAKERLTKVLPWAYRKFISKDGSIKTIPLHSHNDLRKVFGKKELGEKLGKLLLKVVDESYLFGLAGQICKTYTLNKEVFDLFCLELGFNDLVLMKCVATEFFTEYHDELMSGDFVYAYGKESKIKFRTYHRLQGIKKNIREEIFMMAGYKMELDIVNCAPTLIYELAKQNRLDYLIYDDLTHFVENAEVWRLRVAAKNQVSKTTIKLVMNALLHGAELNDKGDIYNIHLAESKTALRKLKADRDIMSIRRQYRNIVKGLRYKFTEEYPHLFYQGIRRIKLTNGQIASIMYQSMESKIRELVLDYYQQQGIRVFQIHDGTYLDKLVDPTEIEQIVKDKLGVSIKFKGKVLERE